MTTTIPDHLALLPLAHALEHDTTTVVLAMFGEGRSEEDFALDPTEACESNDRRDLVKRESKLSPELGKGLLKSLFDGLELVHGACSFEIADAVARQAGDGSERRARMAERDPRRWSLECLEHPRSQLGGTGRQQESED